eukprot:3635682-Prymnesium_polylepis.2
MAMCQASRRASSLACGLCGAKPKFGHTCPGPQRIFETKFDHVLKRMDPNVQVQCYRRRLEDLPSRTEALGRVFRAVLWAVRVKPARERRIDAIAGMRTIDTDMKAVIMGLANLLRNSPPHPRIRWPVRSRNIRSLRVILNVTPIVVVVITNDEQPAGDDEMFSLMQAIFQPHD